MRHLPLVIFMMLSHGVIGQNLVPNHSFEIIDDCPQPPGTLGYQSGAIPTGWWRWGGTPDYFHTCIADTGIGGIPENIFGYQHAQFGEAYSGFAVYHPPSLDGDFRETIGIELSEDLQIGQTYYVSMYVNLATGSYHALGLASNNIGLLCTTQPYYPLGNDPLWYRFPIQNRAQIYAVDPIIDSANWVLISGSFVADSAYRFIVIGNNFDNESTDTIHFVNSLSAYYYVDNVCISLNPLGCDLAHGIGTHSNFSVNVYPNPSCDQFNVQVKSTSLVDLELLDASGKIVWKYYGSGVSHAIGNDLPSGFYVLQYRTDAMLQYYKLIKH